jgi:hypothetical protein
MQGEEEAAAAAAAAGFAIFLVIYFVVLAFFAFVGWKLFVKAGKPGWAAIVPIYNYVVFLEIVGKPVWWVILMMIPVVNLVMLFILSLALAERFGKGAGFGVGLALLGPIFLPMLVFSDAEYMPPPPLPA